MKYVKYSLLVVLCVLSFYFSDRVILYVENMSPIMKTIREVEDDMKVDPVDAIINGNTIIPGKKGSVVNARESYLKMNEFGVFNENFFVYDYIEPDISVEKFKEKIIVGSSKHEYVSLIIDDWKFEDLLKDYEYTFVLTNVDQYKKNDNVTYLNGSFDDYKSINNFLKRKKKLPDIILAEYSNVQTNKDNYIVAPTIDLYHSNIASKLSKIKGGDIIYIHRNVQVSELKVILDSIKYKNLKLMELSEFISE